MNMYYAKEEYERVTISSDNVEDMFTTAGVLIIKTTINRYKQELPSFLRN